MSESMQASTEEPLVSVVIPCFNAEAFVGEAIESVLGQTYPNVEVIVIDDGSTDDSMDVIKAFCARIRWESGPNRGACTARNRGVELAKGEFVQFLDTDDLLLPNKLERQVPHAKAIGTDALSICLGRTDVGDRYFDWQYGRACPPERDPVDYTLSGVLPTTAPLHRRSNLLTVGGFDPVLPCAQEFDLHLRLVCSGIRLCQLPESLFVVRRQFDSVSSDSLKVTRQKFYILGKATELLRSRGALTLPRSNWLGVAYANAALRVDLGGYPDEAARCLKEARALCPEAEILAWTAKWRPVVRVLGALRVARARRRLRSLIGKTP